MVTSQPSTKLCSTSHSTFASSKDIMMPHHVAQVSKHTQPRLLLRN
jgi:hypothetical protein